MSELFDKAEVRKALSTMLEPGAVFEVRALAAQLCGNRRTGTVSGYFDNADACLSELGKLAAAKGIYITLNPVNPALLARCANRLDYADKDSTTKDHHVLRRWQLLVDVDPVRPSGISATDAEKEAAHRKTQDIYAFLQKHGWPKPIAADSGNGYQLIYRIELPCDDGGLTQKVLVALAKRFDGDGVEIDPAVHNESRIFVVRHSRLQGRQHAGTPMAAVENPRCARAVAGCHRRAVAGVSGRIAAEGARERQGDCEQKRRAQQQAEQGGDS
jgi:hypothetical protein